MPTLLSLGQPTRCRELWRSNESVASLFSHLTGNHTRPRNPESNPGERNRDFNVAQTPRDRDDPHKTAERKAVRGENEAEKNKLKLKPIWRLEIGKISKKFWNGKPFEERLKLRKIN